ncbi:MAG: hypothetical protein KGJ90_00110 [Patescibacteria group bacterium]|nr:hypothetical protein [Patescibacteria group bacterium]
MNSLKQAHEAKANAALDMLVRFNGGPMMTRRSIIELRVQQGARIVERKGERILMNADGSWLDARNITKTGIDYAESLIEKNL